MRRPLVAIGALLLLLTSIAVAGAPAGADVRTAASVRVVHGIPGTALDTDEALPVDVSVNDTCALTGFEFGDVVGPLELSGPVDIEIGLADAGDPCSSDPVISVEDLPLTDGAQVSVVAHLDADGAPTASVFEDDLSGTDVPGDGVLAVRHTAAAPEVIAWLGAPGAAASTGLAIANGEQIGRVELAEGDYDAGLGTADQLLFGPATVGIESGEVLAVYAVGVFGEDSFQLITDGFSLPSRIEVVHGIPGTALDADEALPVDVAIDGVCLLTGFEFGDTSGRVLLEEDTYDVTVGLADAGAPCSADPVISVEDLAVPADADLSVVAHLDADGAPTASVFVDDLTPTTPAARSAVSVRHTAAAPEVEVWLGAPGEAAASGLTVANGEQVERVDLATGSYDAGLGTADELLFGPATVELAEDELLAVYAVGVFGEESFQLITQTTDVTRGDSGDAGYGLVAADTSVAAVGTFAAQEPAAAVNEPIVDALATSSDDGYWMAAADGGVFAFGDAHFLGSLGGIVLNQPIVGIDATSDDDGYWLAAADGGVFAYGTAPFLGSAADLPLVLPVVDIAGTASGAGYWLVAADGGVFAYGDAPFLGSLGGLTLNAPIVDIAVAPGGAGYWLVAADGGVFTFGDATFHGSAGGQELDDPVVGITATDSGAGYWITTAGGEVFGYGDAEVIDGAEPSLPVVDIIS